MTESQPKRGSTRRQLEDDDGESNELTSSKDDDPFKNCKAIIQDSENEEESEEEEQSNEDDDMNDRKSESDKESQKDASKITMDNIQGSHGVSTFRPGTETVDHRKTSGGPLSPHDSVENSDNQHSSMKWSPELKRFNIGTSSQDKKPMTY